MFETREQYEAALGQLQTPAEQENFINKYGDGANLPTEAEKAVTRVETPQEAAEPIIPVTEDSPIPDFLPVDAEPATAEEIEQYANYVREEKDAINEAKIRENIQKRKEEYALRDINGDIVYDIDGNIVERDISTGEMMWNSVENIVADTKTGFADLGVGVNEVVQKIVGDEALEEWAENYDSDFLRAFTDEGTEDLIRQAELFESERDEHTGTYTGEDKNIAAAFVNSVTSIGSSAVVNTLTLGGGLPMQFMGQFYRDYNETVAEEKGKSLRELREDGEDSFWAPAAFGALAGISERFGLKGAGKYITNKIRGKLAKKVAHRLLSGNKEGLTELFQTGLELANTAHAKGEDAAEAFVEGISSRDGLEAYLQGFTGGATLAGKGQNSKANIEKVNQLRKAAMAMRAPVDSRKIDELTAKGVELRQALSNTTDPQVKDLITKQIKNNETELKNVAPKANSIVGKMTDPQVEQASKIFDKYDDINNQKKQLLDKYKAGEITIEEYKPAFEALKTEGAKIEEQASKLKAQAEEQTTIREKNLTDLRPKGTWSTITAPKINELAQQNIKNGKLTEEGKWEILQSKEVGDLVNAVISKRFAAQGQEYDATLAEDLKSELMYGGKQSIHGLLGSWDASKSAAPASYIYGQIQNKLTGKLAQQQDKAQQGAARIDQMSEEGRHQIQVADEAEFETAAKDTRRRTSLEQAARLGIEPAFTDSIKGKMETLIGSEADLNPADGNFEKKYVERFRNQITPDVKKAMGRGQNYIDYLTNNADALIDAHSKRTLSKRGNESRAWAEQRPTTQEFLDFYLPKNEDGSKRAKDESHRKNALAEVVSEAIGFRAMEDSIEQQAERSTRDKVNAGFDKVIEVLRGLQGERGTLQSNPLAIAPALLESAVVATKKAYNLGADLATAIEKGYELLSDKVDFKKFKDYMMGQMNVPNETPTFAELREQALEKERVSAARSVNDALNPGKWYAQFQEDNQIDENDFAAQSKATDKILEKQGLRKTIDTKNDQDFEAGRNWVQGTLTKYFPKQFFQQGMFANAGTSAQKRGFFYTGKDDMEQNITGAKDDPNSVWAKTGRYIYGVKDLDAIKKNWGKIKQNNENNWNAFTDMWTTFEKMYKDDKQNAPFIAALLKSAQNSQNHISRTAAGLRAYSKEKGGKRYEEEHSLPQSAVSRYLMQTMLEGGDMKGALANVQKNFFQVALNKTDDGKLKKPGSYNYASKMPDGWKMSDNTWARYFNDNVNGNNGGIDPNSIVFFETGKTVAETFGANLDPKLLKYFQTPKRMGAEFGLPTGKRVGAEFIFNPLVQAQQQVVTEKVGDQFEQFMDKAIGALEGVVKNDGVLQANIAALPIHVLVGGLRATKLAYRGSKNLTKAIEAGYNKVKDYMTRQEWADFTAKAVKEVKDTATGATVGLQFATENAIKLQQQATLNGEFNKIIEQKTKGRIKADKVFGKADIGKPKKLGILRKFFGHPSAEDLKGLIYTVLPSGKDGDAALKFFEDSIFKPYQRGVTQMNAYKANLREGFQLASKLASIGKLNKTVPNTNHSWNNAVRVALARMNGQEIKGIDATTAEQLIEAVNADPKIKAYTDKINSLFDGYFKWDPKDINRPIGGELASIADKHKRKEFLKDYLNNAEQVFSEENLNKIEATAGKEVRENLEKTLQRMKTGKNRTISTDSSTNKFLDWMNNSVAMIMFANMRSAGLQLLSMANYIGADGNNLFKAGKNFANTPRWVNDVKTLWDSEYSKGRRKGLGFDISSQEIADAGLSRSAWNDLMDKIRAAGFIPTKFMDSIATTVGGATYYRSRIQHYEKLGASNPEQRAMEDWVALTEENQQSADPSKISQIQAGPLGRVIFAFGNTPFQYARIMKRAVQDIASGRGNKRRAAERIIWYGGLQSVIFSGLQQALWMGDDEEEKEKRKEFAMLSTITSWFKSLGLGGAFASTAISLLSETQKEGHKDYIRAAASISPPVSKKLSQAAQFAGEVSKGNYAKAGVIATELGGNIPTQRALTKMNNLLDIVEGDLTGMEQFMKFMGWSDYSLGRKKKSEDDYGFSNDEFKFDDNGFEFEEVDFGEEESPFDKGEAGQAHKDGTIEVDPNLSPDEKAKTIVHEKQHVKDMKENGLDYDDKNVYWKGSNYPRRKGKILDNGTWKKEGDPSLPWEKRAYKAEEGVTADSPIDREKRERTRKERPKRKSTIEREARLIREPYNSRVLVRDAEGNLIPDPYDQYSFITRPEYDPRHDDRNFLEKGWDYGRSYVKEYAPGVYDAIETWYDNVDNDGIDSTDVGFTGSPINRDKPKPGTPEWEAVRKEGVKFNQDWYNEPTTRAMLEEQAPRYVGKIDDRLKMLDEVHFDHGAHLEPGEVAEYWRNNYADTDAGEHKHNVSIGPDHSIDRAGLVEHELSHAAGWDYDLGKKVLDVTGGPDKSTRYGRYLSSPDEAYGNLQELRKILDLKPDQRDLTPEQLQKLADEKGNDDVKAYIKAFGPENVAKAHNQVASNTKRRSLDDLYNA